MYKDLINCYEYNLNGFSFFKTTNSSFYEIDKCLLESDLTIIYEKGIDKIRSVYGLQNSILFNNWLYNQKIIKEIVEQILGLNVYLYLAKINFKNKSEDSIWPFHRDFPFWYHFDNVRFNNMVNVVLFLDDVEEGTGELMLIPRSHNEFLIRESENYEVPMSIDGSASSDLLFSFKEQEINYFRNKYGVYNAVGLKGYILVFDPNIIHGSSNSILDISRKIMILTFNRCEIKPVIPSERPEFLCSSNYSPIKWDV